MCHGETMVIQGSIDTGNQELVTQVGPWLRDPVSSTLIWVGTQSLATGRS